MDLQWLIVVVAVVLSALFVFRKYAPATVRAWRQRMAIALMRDGNRGWRRSLGLKIAPDPVAASRACAGCDGCD